MALPHVGKWQRFHSDKYSACWISGSWEPRRKTGEGRLRAISTKATAWGLSKTWVSRVRAGGEGAAMERNTVKGQPGQEGSQEPRGRDGKDEVVNKQQSVLPW